MNLKKRFFLYGFGFAVGALVVLFIWNKKEASFDYMPDTRVLKNIQSKTINYSQHSKVSLTAYSLDSISISSMIQNGNVDFKKSNTKLDSCKIYWINTNYKYHNWSLIIENCDSIATIKKIIKEK